MQLVLGNYADADKLLRAGKLELRPHEARILSCVI
jgi:hypothetical protein